MKQRDADAVHLLREIMSDRTASGILVIINLRAKQGYIETARAALMKITDPIRINPDCFEFRVYQDQQDPQNFTLWERWVSKEALFSHGKRDYMAEYMALKDEIFEEPSGGFYQELHAP